MPCLRFDIITIFPGFFAGPLDYGIVRQAGKKAIISVVVHDLRAFTTDKHKSVDDRPFGGGEGMVLKPEPLFRAVDYVYSAQPEVNRQVILLSPQGKKFDQALAFELSKRTQLTLICGRYEGVDERIAEHLATDEISIGDYVLSGGELAACVVVDAVTRLIPGVLHNDSSAQKESFTGGFGFGGTAAEMALLDCPQYTRPEVFEGMKVPEVLLSGNHARIKTWRYQKALEKTLKNRPDLLQYQGLSEADQELLKKKTEL
jgi:tRNA (guanine37-N1)-methyltransferase